MTGADYERQPFGGLVVAMLTDVEPGPDLRTYLEDIDATLEPFSGRFVIHGGQPSALEGPALGADLIMIGFPTREAAHDWYASPGYQRLAHLRQGFSIGRVTLCSGAPDDHRAADGLEG